MRDQRLIAVHRGGKLARVDHGELARWAVDCADSVMHLFARHAQDVRPQRALEVARAWARGDVKTGVAMKAAVAAHAAARAVSDKAAIAAARAAGHAVATAHAADHCMGAMLYALKALQLDGDESRALLDRQLAKLPPHLLEPVAAGIEVRLKPMGICGTK